MRTNVWQAIFGLSKNARSGTLRFDLDAKHFLKFFPKGNSFCLDKRIPPLRIGKWLIFAADQARFPSPHAGKNKDATFPTSNTFQIGSAD